MTHWRFPDEGSVREFLTALASPDAAHGPVSASAVAAGMGVSLLVVSAALPKTRSDSVEDRTMLASTATALGSLQEELLETIETETAVRLFAARRMPHGSAAEQSEREAAIQLALRAAADVPLEVMRLCADALKHAVVVARHASRAASTDIALAVALIQAAFMGARAALEAKLSSLTDAGYTRAAAEDIVRLSDEVTVAATAAVSAVQIPPA